MSDLKMAQLKLAKFKAGVDAAGLDTGPITNDVHVSNHADSPAWGTAGGGNDFIWADRTTGGDYFGFGGNDIFVGTSVGEFFHGGTGSDTVAYVNATSGVQINLNQESQQGWAAGDRFDSIENVVGSQYADQLIGTAGSNKLFGYGGNDTIAGNGGNDILDGGAGQDKLTGMLSGTTVATGGADRDQFDFHVGANDFNLTVTDLQPLFYNGNTQTAPSQATARADMNHEFFHLTFDYESGAHTAQEVHDAMHFSGYADHADGTTDAIWSVETPYAHGTITFQNVLDSTNLPTDVFTIYFDPQTYL
jgi:Ca2+-binding RTX toxin-like protein